MSAAEHIHIAEALLESCRLPGYEPARDLAPTYPQLEDGINEINNGLIAAQTHALIAQVEILQLIAVRLGGPESALSMTPQDAATLIERIAIGDEDGQRDRTIQHLIDKPRSELACQVYNAAHETASLNAKPAIVQAGRVLGIMP